VNWSAIRSGLIPVVAAITGIADEDAVKWRGNSAAGTWRRGTRVTMSCRSIRSIGRDEIRLDGPDELFNMVATVCGNRQFTWSLLFESETDGASFTSADRFRAALRFQSTKDALRALGLAVADIEATQALEFNSQGKSFSSAVVDVQINAAENLTDDNDGAADYIANAAYASDGGLLGEDGNPTSTQIDEQVST